MFSHPTPERILLFPLSFLLHLFTIVIPAQQASTVILLFTLCTTRNTKKNKYYHIRAFPEVHQQMALENLELA